MINDILNTQNRKTFQTWKKCFQERELVQPTCTKTLPTAATELAINIFHLLILLARQGYTWAWHIVTILFVHRMHQIMKRSLDSLTISLSRWTCISAFLCHLRIHTLYPFNQEYNIIIILTSKVNLQQERILSQNLCMIDSSVLFPWKKTI